MTPERFTEITSRYPALRIAILGDFCLDRYLEIDPTRAETSIETGLPVYNVIRVRAQPGAGGTILNNLAALGVDTIHPIGFCGEDGEGFELRRALQARRGVTMEHFHPTTERRTFTYCKPLVVLPGQLPWELNRFDSKNWTPTPPAVEEALIRSVREVAPNVDALILLEQAQVPDTGVITRRVLAAVGELAREWPCLLISADSRRGLRGYPPVIFKMNAAELAVLTGTDASAGLEVLQQTARDLARQNGRPVVVTLAERGILGATPEGTVEHVPALPVCGEIDIVGAGDAVTANLMTALAAGATLREALELANAAASVVIHQLGTTGEATVEQLCATLFPST